MGKVGMFNEVSYDMTTATFFPSDDISPKGLWFQPKGLLLEITNTGVGNGIFYCTAQRGFD